ncbi:MAG TPA: hypothetical protein VFG00_06090 [Acidothermaceae bacterium]|nr:hypothetical protein [Acidothermaceae bacterium]
MHQLPSPPKRRRTGLIAGISVSVVVLALLGFVGARAFLAAATHGRDIAGAPGYVTFSGPTGNSFPVGRPFGHACQPIRFTVEEHVTDAVYAQVVSVVNEARADGLDVTLEDRTFAWKPDSLYYPAGTTSAGVLRVGIFANTGAPNMLSNGQPAHVILGYDASPDADGKHDDMVGPQGTLQMETLAGDVVGQRRAVREIIALTQGVAGSTRSDTGLGSASTRDSFSPTDIAAMKNMSGCGNAPTTVVEHTPI